MKIGILMLTLMIVGASRARKPFRAMREVSNTKVSKSKNHQESTVKDANDSAEPIGTMEYMAPPYDYNSGYSVPEKIERDTKRILAVYKHKSKTGIKNTIVYEGWNNELCIFDLYHMKANETLPSGYGRCFRIKRTMPTRPHD